MGKTTLDQVHAKRWRAVQTAHSNCSAGAVSNCDTFDALGDRIDVLMDGGIQRGSHALKALSVGAKAVGLGRH
jgi:isopentenyl diphosphate isomerase/L-lactate dehydrogenase-like FMN-dependent dehydrogenase